MWMQSMWWKTSAWNWESSVSTPFACLQGPHRTSTLSLSNVSLISDYVMKQNCKLWIVIQSHVALSILSLWKCGFDPWWSNWELSSGATSYFHFVSGNCNFYQSDHQWSIDNISKIISDAWFYDHILSLPMMHSLRFWRPVPLGGPPHKSIVRSTWDWWWLWWSSWWWYWHRGFSSEMRMMISMMMMIMGQHLSYDLWYPLQCHQYQKHHFCNHWSDHLSLGFPSPRQFLKQLLRKVYQ